MTPSPDTIAAIATPPGRGGVGIVRVSGSGVPTIIAGIVGRDLLPRHATVAALRGADGGILDQGIALSFPAPNSYTGEHVLELHGHGGAAVQRLILARVLELGARIAEPGEFTQRAFLNGKLDLAQAEGVADLIDAATTTAARAAARSLTGEFSREIRTLVDDLTGLRMFTEATLDFPDEDVELLRAAGARDKLAALRSRLATIEARGVQGALLREGLAVVLVGQPNVGKSSLLNRLAGEELAIVTPIAGTTRDAVRSQIEVHGVPLTVIDTAGLRPTDDPIETLGIERTWNAIAQADLALVLVDAVAADEVLPAPDAAILARLPRKLPCIVVHNKIDLVERRPHDEMRREGDETRRHVWLSAKTGAGVDALRHAIMASAGAHDDMTGALLARERHLAALRDAAAHLAAAERHLGIPDPPLELFAEELREAQTALSAITGEFTADDLLGVIFSRFCIGK